MTPQPASSPPDTPRHVVGFFTDQHGTKLVWNWATVFYEGGYYLSADDHEDYSDAIQFWADVEFPQQEAKWPN